MPLEATVRANRQPQVNDLETGSFAAPLKESSTQHSSTAARLTVATYNIRYAVGSFLISGSLLRRVGISRPRRRSSLVARHIARAALAFSDGARLPPPDVIALQEADKETIRAEGHHVARELAHALKMNYAHASARAPHSEEPQPNRWYLDFEEHLEIDEKGTTGIALLSRLPMDNLARVELPFAGCEWRPRLALAASIPFGARRLFIFNAHIDPHASIKDRLAQHQAIIAAALEASGNNPIVMLGDFNTLTREARVRMCALMEERGFRTPFRSGVATWRAGLIRLHTDWIFARGAVRFARWGVARKLSVSDHWPVWAELEETSDARECIK